MESSQANNLLYSQPFVNEMVLQDVQFTLVLYGRKKITGRRKGAPLHTIIHIALLKRNITLTNLYTDLEI